MKLIALRDLPNRVKAGDAFEEADGRALVLLKLGVARKDLTPERVATPSPESDDIPDTPTEPTPEADEAPPTRRRYRRRDLQADE